MDEEVALWISKEKAVLEEEKPASKQPPPHAGSPAPAASTTTSSSTAAAALSASTPTSGASGGGGAGAGGGAVVAVVPGKLPALSVALEGYSPSESQKFLLCDAYSYNDETEAIASGNRSLMWWEEEGFPELRRFMERDSAFDKQYQINDHIIQIRNAFASGYDTDAWGMVEQPVVRAVD
eukprot:TRINITY_DN2983_c0_g1_i16.p3 TRINITY_DN2983_c0_g1~~TRINITY_DN2983_c0_g1_i16.p3  ORF type:complete len:180 (+),score=63.54 TRINITY_DN2983_c0_g1_i16:1571-2110(+)